MGSQGLPGCQPVNPLAEGVPNPPLVCHNSCRRGAPLPLNHIMTIFQEVDLLVRQAVIALEAAGWQEEANELDRDRRWSVTLKDMLLVREDAEDYLARLAAN